MLCNYNSQYKTFDAIFIIYLKQTENNHTNMQIISKMTKKLQIKRKKMLEQLYTRTAEVEIQIANEK